ncbi:MULTISPECIES: hypothetical protein [unclassified Schlesneria]|uniref:hypothetical protein n=1 Tax=unclassified Schlesneria TaxID=2762017 RepID=UPI002F0677D1
MDPLSLFNGLEAAFWIPIGAALFFRSRGPSRNQHLGRVAALWFLLFGISDIFEIFTGAWWRPWPLLLLKGTCVIALIWCGIAYRSRNRGRGRSH